MSHRGQNGAHGKIARLDVEMEPKPEPEVVL